MAREDQIVLLKQGPQAWNAWRREQPNAVVDLSTGGLRGLDLAGADLSGADLRGADLRGTVLDGSNLAGARLEGANLFKATLDGADLYKCDLSGAQFLHCGQLEVAQNWQSAYRDEGLACGATIPVMADDNADGPDQR